jgi:hypothetical protein
MKLKGISGTFSIQSVIFHSGTDVQGHFWAYVRAPEGWLVMDCMKTYVSVEQKLPSGLKGAVVMILRLNAEISPMAPMPVLNIHQDVNITYTPNNAPVVGYSNGADCENVTCSSPMDVILQSIAIWLHTNYEANSQVFDTDSAEEATLLKCFNHLLFDITKVQDLFKLKQAFLNMACLDAAIERSDSGLLTCTKQSNAYVKLFSQNYKRLYIGKCAGGHRKVNNLVNVPVLIADEPPTNETQMLRVVMTSLTTTDNGQQYLTYLCSKYEWTCMWITSHIPVQICTYEATYPATVK